MPFEPIDFIDSREYLNKRWLKTLPTLDLPALPSVVFYDPLDEKAVKTKSYVMERAEERTRFLQFNWYKREYNRRLKTKHAAPLLEKVTHMREYLTRVNIALVNSMVARTRAKFSRLDWNEAISEGQIGLMRAINGYDIKFGTKFSTYAVRIILNCLMSAAQKRQKQTSRLQTVELPDSFSDDAALEAAQGDSDLGFALETLKRVMDSNQAKLTHVEQAVIRTRFGPDKVTLEEVGVRFGLSKERIRQIQNKALEKLRSTMIAA